MHLGLWLKVTFHSFLSTLSGSGHTSCFGRLVYSSGLAGLWTLKIILKLHASVRWCKCFLRIQRPLDFQDTDKREAYDAVWNKKRTLFLRVCFVSLHRNGTTFATDQFHKCPNPSEVNCLKESRPSG